MEKNKIRPVFEDNHIHSNYSDDAKCSLEEIFEYNNTHDKLNLVISDHVGKNTDWFDARADQIDRLRKEYADFLVKIGCEVKIVDENGELNTTDRILERTEVVLGSVHFFPDMRPMSPKEFLEREFALTKILAQNSRIDILAHPFSMSKRLFRLEPPVEYVQAVYDLCVKNNIKFEYSRRHALDTISNFVKQKIYEGEINNFSFGSDMHDDCGEIGYSTFHIFDPINILVTGCGSAVAQGIIKSAKLSKVNSRIIGIDSSPLAAGLYRSDVACLVPRANEAGYTEAIIKICNQERVDLILVGTDIELPILSHNKEEIESKTAARLIISSTPVISITDDKWKTVNFLKENGFPYPKSYINKNGVDFNKNLGFPLVVKPRFGFRSIGFYIVKNNDELEKITPLVENPIFQEYLSSEDTEYTCSGFFYEKKCYGVMPVKAWRRHGDTYKAEIKRDVDLEKFVEAVGIKLGIDGPCNFQFLKTADGLKIFEINCRFSGTTGTVSFLGFNVVNLLLQHIFLGRELFRLCYREARMLRYWNEVFINESDYDNLRKNNYLANPGSSLSVF